MALLYTHTACVYSTIHILQISLIVWLRPFLVCVGGGGFVRGYVFILKMPAGIKECLVSGWWWSENSGVQHVASAAGGLRGNQLCVCFLLMQTPAAVLLRNPFFSLSPPPLFLALSSLWVGLLSKSRTEASRCTYCMSPLIKTVARVR